MWYNSVAWGSSACELSQKLSTVPLMRLGLSYELLVVRYLMQICRYSKSQVLQGILLATIRYSN